MANTNKFDLARLKRVTPKSDVHGLSRIMASEHEGRWWLSDSHWLMPTDKWHAALDQLNLPIHEDFVAERRGATFVRTEQEAPNFASIIDANKGASGKVERLMVEGTNTPAFMRGGDIWQLPYRCVDDDGAERIWGLNLDFYELFVPALNCELTTNGSGKPVVFTNPNEGLMGLAMPIRHPW